MRNPNSVQNPSRTELNINGGSICNYNNLSKKKLNELKQQYRQVELISRVSVTLNGNCVSEKFTAGKTPTTQTGCEVGRNEFPALEQPPGTTLVENGTQVNSNVWAKGKRKPDCKSFYFLWN